MKITKKYPGLTRAKNCDYILNGSLISEEGIEIDLDDRLFVTGRIKAGWDIEAVGGITAGCGIEAGRDIEAGDKIESGWGIKSGGGIKAGTYIDCGKRIFAGTSVLEDADTCDKTIRCAELRNGTVAYGDLIITKREETNED